MDKAEQIQKLEVEHDALDLELEELELQWYGARPGNPGVIGLYELDTTQRVLITITRKRMAVIERLLAQLKG